MADSVVLSVTALNRYVKSVLDSDLNLQNIYVKGEISNFKAGGSNGHWYFTLKDEGACIRAAMFRFANSRMRFMPENDMSVIVRGKVSLYEKGGDYQLIADDMQPDGYGALAVAFEQLKKRLGEKGMFDSSHKKPIPAFPQRVGVVTSGTGAAVRDIINVITRRYPLCEIVIAPVAVQGENAAPEISQAIKLFNEKQAADVLIVGRGGGSIEDLWAFNEELTANAVYGSEIPVISAVGHETDFTICDFVADLRAPTPSAAAELCVPDVSELGDALRAYSFRISGACAKTIETKRAKLLYLKGITEKNSPKHCIENNTLTLDRLDERIRNAAGLYLERAGNTLEGLVARADANSPMKIMAKGYSAVFRDGKAVNDASLLSAGDKINIRMYKGEIDCEVTGK